LDTRRSSFTDGSDVAVNVARQPAEFLDNLAFGRTPDTAGLPGRNVRGIHAIGHFYAGDPAGAREWVARHRDIGGINYMALGNVLRRQYEGGGAAVSGTPGHRGDTARRLIPRPPALASQVETSTQDDARALQAPQV
jgi:hypothetical protein